MRKYWMSYTNWQISIYTCLLRCQFKTYFIFIITMALTSTGSYTDGSRKYLNLNTKNVPVFMHKPKDWEIQTFSKVDWDFVSCSFFDNEYEWEVTRKMELILRDWEENYYIQSSLSSTCRSILNTLASCEDGVWRVSISVYEKEGKKRAFVTVDWEKVWWKLSIEEQNALIKEVWVVKWKKVVDLSELESKLESLCVVLHSKKSFIRTY